jgi:Trypsin
MRRSLVVGLLGVGALLAGCGGAPQPSGLGRARSLIVGGSVDNKDKAAVGIAIDLSAYGIGFFGQCSGTLIAQNLVLTARHCVALLQNSGPQDSVDCSQTSFGLVGGGDLFRATTLTVRPSADGPAFYKGTGTVTTPSATGICGNDVALITLDGSGVPPSAATPIVPRIDSTPVVGDKYSAIGYGLTDPNDDTSDGTRMRADGNQVSCVGTDCGELSGVQAGEWEGTSRTCPGDSGGPAIDAQGRVMGVLSRGPSGCLSSVYSNVASHKDLIVQAALAAAKAGGYMPAFWATTGSSTPPPRPAPDPLGTACSKANRCPKGYLCWSNNGVTGDCVPPCSAQDTTCPSGYTCNVKGGACLSPAEAAPASSIGSSSQSGGCSLAGSESGAPLESAPWFAGLLGLYLGAWRRRRARRNA